MPRLTPIRLPARSAGDGHIQIGDDDFDSFNDALHTAPWVVGLAFLVAGSILLTPVFLLIGIIWYKLRKTRLQNEALLKLAEKGVMPPAQAVDTMMSGVTPERGGIGGRVHRRRPSRHRSISRRSSRGAARSGRTCAGA